MTTAARQCKLQRHVLQERRRGKFKKSELSSGEVRYGRSYISTAISSHDGGAIGQCSARNSGSIKSGRVQS